MNTMTQDRIRLSAPTSNTNSYEIPATPVAAPAPVGDRIESAVFAYIQARRSLGETRVSSSEIARALRLPQRLVDAAVREMTDRGVRIL